MCEPSIEPAHCGMPHFVLKLPTVSLNLLPVGKLMYLGNNTLTILLQVSLTIQQTVHLANPNR